MAKTFKRYVLKRNEDGMYVAKNGYTTQLKNAYQFKSRVDAGQRKGHIVEVYEVPQETRITKYVIAFRSGYYTHSYDDGDTVTSLTSAALFGSEVTASKHITKFRAGKVIPVTIIIESKEVV